MKYFTDILIWSGVGAAVYGAWLLQPEAALIVGGGLALGTGLIRIVTEAIRRGGK